jgi:hypothetical protein
VAQIDTPYLTEGFSGLTFAVDKFKGWPHGVAHHAGTRRTLAPGRLCKRSPVTLRVKPLAYAMCFDTSCY